MVMWNMKKREQKFYNLETTQALPTNWLQYESSFLLHVYFILALFMQTAPVEFLMHEQNSRKGQFCGLQKIGAKKIPEHIRCHKQTELERAKATLMLASLPKSLPCRNK